MDLEVIPSCHEICDSDLVAKMFRSRAPPPSAAAQRADGVRSGEGTYLKDLTLVFYLIMTVLISVWGGSSRTVVQHE